MYVSYCGARGTCTDLKNTWNRAGPCSTYFRGMCRHFFYAEGGLGCVNRGTIMSAGALPSGSCEVGFEGGF